MKLCWDNLNKLDYIGNNTWKRLSTNHYFIVKDKCIGCGNEFLTYKYDNADYCCMSCAKSGKNNGMFGKSGKDNPFYGRKHSYKTRRLISKNHADISKQDNPNWKGGVKDLKLPLYNTHKYKIEYADDIDNCIAFCKNYHKEVNKQKGCGYYELRCQNENSF